jgi:hypothetical protein
MTKIINSFKKYLIMGFIAIISVIGLYNINTMEKGETKVEAANYTANDISTNVIGFTVTVGNSELSTGYHTDTIRNFLTLTKYRCALYGGFDTDYTYYNELGGIPFWYLCVSSQDNISTAWLSNMNIGSIATYLDTDGQFDTGMSNPSQWKSIGSENGTITTVLPYNHTKRNISVQQGVFTEKYLFGNKFIIDTQSQKWYGYETKNTDGSILLPESNSISTFKVYNASNVVIDSNFNVSVSSYLAKTNNERLRLINANTNLDVTGQYVPVGTPLRYEITNQKDYEEYSVTGFQSAMPKSELNVSLQITQKVYTARWDKSVSYTLTNGNKPQDFNFTYGQAYTLPELYRVGYRLTHYLVNDVKYYALEALNTKQTNDLRIVPVFEKVTYQLTNIDNEVYSLVFDKATAQIGDTVTFTLTLKDKGYTLNSIVSNCIPNGSLNVNATSFVLTPSNNNTALDITVSYKKNVYNIYFSDSNRLSSEVITLNYLDKQLIEEKYQQARDILKDGYYLTNLKAYAYNNGVLGEEFDITEAFNMPSTDLIVVGEWALQNYKITLSLDKTVNYVDKDGKALTSSKFYKDALDALNITISNLDETLVINDNITSEASLPTVKAPYRAFKGWYLASNKNQFDNEGLTNLTYYYTIAEAIENNPDKLVFNLYPYFEVVKANISFMIDANTVFETVENYVNAPLATMSAPNEPQSETGVFGGWYFDSKFENEFVVGQSNTPEASEVKVFAKWLKNTYKVVFYNWNGDILSEEDVLTNQVPNYTGATPERPISQGKIYKFIGWDKEITKVKENVSYTAQYNYELIDYVVSVYDGNDGLVLSTTYHFGDELVLPETATKTSTAQFDYEFAGWDNKSNYVYSNMDIRANFKEILRSYCITWNVNGNEIDMQFNYGDTPVFTGNLEKNGTERSNFEFAGWSPEITPVVGNQIYTAIYDEVDKVFEVTFYNVYNEEIAKVSYKYGEKIQMPENYTTFSLKEGVRFNGWVNENNESIDNLLNVSETLRAYPSFADENNQLIDNNPLNLSKEEDVKVVVEELDNINDVDLSSISDSNSSLRYYSVSRYVGGRRITNDTNGGQATFKIDNDSAGTYHAYLVKEDGSLEEVEFESLSADGLVLNMEHLGNVIVRYDNIPTINLADGIRILTISSIVLASLCAVVFLRTRKKNNKIIQLEKRD